MKKPQAMFNRYSSASIISGAAMSSTKWCCLHAYRLIAPIIAITPNVAAVATVAETRGSMTASGNPMNRIVRTEIASTSPGLCMML